MARSISRSSSSESGLTLVELIVAMSMAIVITGAAVAMLVSALNRQPDLTERADQVGTAQTAVERIVRDIRQGIVGKTVLTTGASSSKLELETYVGSQCGTTAVTTATKCKVTYTCEPEVCKRTTTGTTTKTQNLITGVKNSATVFEVVKGLSPCATSSTEIPRFVAVALELKSKKGGVTKIEDGAGMQSCS